MARRSSHKKTPSPLDPDPITREANRLAVEYDIALGDAQICLARLVDAFEMELLGSAEDLEEALWDEPLCWFEDALLMSAPEQVIRLFREEDLQQFGRQLRTFGRLVCGTAPVFTLQELAAHARDFVTFLDDHRDYLVKTGLPPTCFRSCGWLHIHLGVTRLPLRCD
jgi:hypothetical protein